MKIGVLISGGVDSAIAALLLQQAGHHIIAITMVNWNQNIVSPAVQVASSLGIEHHVIDLKQQFASRVISNFCTTYQNGATPNPCVLCNELFKFGTLLELARSLGCHKIATGHYARVESKSTGEWVLKKGLDPRKDQSYFLYRMTQSQLASVMFPLGVYHKDQVREMARQHGIGAVQQEESQEICFICGNYRDFLVDRISFRSGDFVDTKGQVLGQHRGVPFYTIGQRHGLNLNTGMPVYVVDIDAASNRIVVGRESDLYRRTLIADDLSCVSPGTLIDGMQVRAKIRYRSPEAEATLAARGPLLQVTFTEPQRAVTRGQSVVFYKDDEVLGGGIIT